MFNASARTRRVLLISGAAASLSCGLCWAILAFNGSKSSNPSRQWLQSALLCDYYEHGIEHAPPHDPSGCMQRRERGYHTPADPYAYLRRELSAGVNDRELLSAFDEWQSGWKQGRASSEERLEELEALAARSWLKSIDLMEVGRAVQFLDGDRAAAAWYRAALAKAQLEFRDTRPGDPGAKEFLVAIEQTKALWRLKDYVALQARFSLARDLYPELSPEARRAGYLDAEASYYLGKYQRAADIIMSVQAEHEQVGDLDQLEKGDSYEMHWVEGVFLQAATRFDQAVPHFRFVANVPGGFHTQEARQSLILALASAGRFSEATRDFQDWLASSHPSQETADAVRSWIDKCYQNEVGQANPREGGRREIYGAGGPGRAD